MLICYISSFSSLLSLHAYVNPLSGLNEPVFLLSVHIGGEKQSKCERFHLSSVL